MLNPVAQIWERVLVEESAEMKVKDGFRLRIIGDEGIIVPLGSRVIDCRALITLNQTGMFLWEHLSEDTTEDALAVALVNEYEVDLALARADVRAFIAELADNRLVE